MSNKTNDNVVLDKINNSKLFIPISSLFINNADMICSQDVGCYGFFSNKLRNQIITC